MVWPAIIASGAGLLGSYLSGRGNAGGTSGNNNAMGYLNQVPQAGRETYNPYINRGAEAQNAALGSYNQMAQDPMGFLNQIISGYKPSEGYKFREKNALNAARNSAAHGGFSGTPNDQMQQADLVNGLLGEDMQQWIQNILGIQGGGLSGQQHVGDIGYNASSNLADLLGSTLGNQATLAYEDRKEQRANKAALMGGLSNLLGMGAGGIGKSDWFSSLLGGNSTGLGASPARGNSSSFGAGNRSPSLNRSMFSGNTYGGGRG